MARYDESKTRFYVAVDRCEENPNKKVVWRGIDDPYTLDILDVCDNNDEQK